MQKPDYRICEQGKVKNEQTEKILIKWRQVVNSNYKPVNEAVSYLL